MGEVAGEQTAELHGSQLQKPAWEPGRAREAGPPQGKQEVQGEQCVLDAP